MNIITTHKNTDFDALASVYAAAMIYPDSVPVIPKAVNPNVRAFLSIHKDLFDPVTVGDIDLNEVRQLVVVDVNRWDRLDRLTALKQKSDLKVIVWDHHDGDGDIAADERFEEPTGATVTQLAQRLREQKKILTPIQATLFLAGIYEDTGNLSFASTTACDAHAAAFFLERKADLSIISTLLRPAYGQKQKNVLFEMLKNASRGKLMGFTTSYNQVEISGHTPGLSVVVNMYREIVNVDAAFGIFYHPERDKCMVIGRSLPDTIDVGAVMRGLGGGGHAGAGSVMLAGSDREAVESILINQINGNRDRAMQISDLMSFPVLSVSPDTPMRAVALILREKGCTGVPVVDNDRLVGIISRRDFRKVRNESQIKAPVKAYMSTKIMTIDPGKSPNKAARIMVKHDVGRLPVVDEEKQIIGIVTRSDVMRFMYDLLPD